MSQLIRELVASDWPRMARLRAGRKTHAGAPVESFSSVPITWVDTRYQTAPCWAVGCFVDQKLVAYICAYSYPGSKFWVLDLMISSGDPSNLHACLDACLERYEALGVNEFYYAFPEKWARAYKNYWRESIPRLQRYVIEDILVIPPRAIPQEDWIWEHILHNTVVPVGFLLRRSRLETQQSQE